MHMLARCRELKLIVAVAVLVGLTPGGMLVVSGCARAQDKPDVSEAPPLNQSELAPRVNVEQAVAAVHTLVPDMDDELVYRGYGNLRPFDVRHVFVIERTSEEFSVNAYTGRVVLWRMGLSPFALANEEHERREQLEQGLMERFYEVEPREMVKVTDYYWYRLLPSGVLANVQRCGFFWNADGTRVARFFRFFEPVGVASSPRLTPDEASRIAVSAITEALDIPAEELTRRPPYRRPPYENAAEVRADGMGVQRLDYQFSFAADDQGVVAISVDAATGLISVPNLGIGPASQIVRAHFGLLDLQIAGRMAFLEPSYQPRTIDGTAYLSARYLDSLLWQGDVVRLTTEDQDKAVFTVKYGSVEVRIETGVPVALEDGAPPVTTAVPLLLGDELWLPSEVVGAITGWQVRVDSERRTVVLTPPPDAAEGNP